jgi:transcriptional regulator with XRE-family HTH domain
VTNRVKINPLLDEIIKESGLTQEELAKELGYDRAYLSQARKEGTKKLHDKLIAYLDNVRKSKEESINKKAPPVEDGTIKDKYIALLEAQNQHLQAQITAQWEARVAALEARLNELLNNQLVSEAMSQAYQEYVIEVFWKIQGKKVNGKQVLVEIQKKAFEKLSTFEEQGLHIEQLS